MQAKLRLPSRRLAVTAGAAVFVLLGALHAPRPARAVPFLPKTDFATGSAPTSVAVGDLDGDGKPDLAVTSSATVSILLGTGAGSFGAKTDFTTDTGSASVAIADFNRDGKPDLAVANDGANSVSILLGAGGGSFGAKTDFATGANPESVAVADFNRDGNLDLALANGNGNTVSVLLGTGSGTFGAKTDVATGAHPLSVAIGDLNGDASADLVTANFTGGGGGSVSVLLGLGNGAFGARTDFATGNTGSIAVAIADLNHDGKLDVAAANYDGGTVSVLLGSGTGSLGASTDFPTAAHPRSITVGDFNADGTADLATADETANAASILLGTGTGSFGAKTDYATGASPRFLTSGDVNADGKPDLLVANTGANTVAILLGTGANSSATFLPKSDYGTGANPVSVAIGDVNGDGKPDLAATNYAANTVSLLLGTGTGSFGAKTDFATGVTPRSVAINDLNGDGKPDLAVANQSSNNVSVLLGTGTGSFGARVDYATDVNSFSVAIADFNGDGKPDLAVANYGSASVSVLLGSGGGSFGAKTDYPTGDSPSSVAVGDFNLDGKPDLVVSDYGSGTVSVLLGTGTGSFGTRTPFATGAVPFSVAIGDFNVDGKPDLVVAKYTCCAVSVLLGTGTGSFGARSDFTTTATPFSVATGDVNGDGKPDLAISNQSANIVSVMLGTGAGSFGAETDFATGGQPLALALGDLNGDGSPDLAVANYNVDTVSVLLQGPAFAITSALYCPGSCYPGGGASDLLAMTGYAQGVDPGTSFSVSGKWDTTCAPTIALAGAGVYQPAIATTSDAAGNLSGAEAVTGVTSPVGAAAVGKYVSKHLIFPDGRTADSTCAVVQLDTDGDGIADSIDPAPGVAGNAFTDGTTSGTITARNGCYVSVVDAPSPADGVVIGNVCPPSGGGPATLSVCGFSGSLILSDGGAIVGSCDSFRSGAISGTATFEFGPTGQEDQYVLTQGPGDYSIVADLGGNAFSVVANQANVSSVTLTFLGHVIRLPEGTAITAQTLMSGGIDLTNSTQLSGQDPVLVDGVPLAQSQLKSLPANADGDGCEDAKEALLVPPTSASDPWDFYAVPVPALFAAPNPLVVFRDANVSAADAQAIFAYFKKSAHTGTLEYEQDLNNNGIKDGIEYDRSVVGPGQSGPPNGTIAASDAQLAFAQFKKGYHC